VDGIFTILLSYLYTFTQCTHNVYYSCMYILFYNLLNSMCASYIHGKCADIYCVCLMTMCETILIKYIYCKCRWKSHMYFNCAYIQYMYFI